MNSFVERFIKKPPTLFPLVALFHIALLAYSIFNAWGEPFSSSIWIQPLWMAAYTFVWLFVCDMKRWAAYTYIGITTANLAVHFIDSSRYYESSLFLIDVLFSMILMAYIKRFN